MLFQRLLPVLFSLLILYPSAGRGTGGKPTPYIEKDSVGRVRIKGKTENGERTGRWVFYNEQGNIIAEEKYRKGKFRWRVEYNEKHQRTRGVDAQGNTHIYKGCNCR